jgi:hypothetical protein
MAVTQTGPLSVKLELRLMDASTGAPIIKFAEELTQELHLLAVDASLARLVHEHVKTAAADGSFTARIEVPRPGLYHVYADTVPVGLSQQVLRFDVEVGTGAAPDAPLSVLEAQAGLVTVATGDYAVTLDLSRLAANEETPLPISITRDGAPANDLAPYLGVGAHAVLIRAANLAYVHAHPTTASSHAEPGGHQHAPAAEPTRAEGHDHTAGALPARVDPEMVLQLTPPGAGRYTLFLEFIGGGQVHTATVPLNISVR